MNVWRIRHNFGPSLAASAACFCFALPLLHVIFSVGTRTRCTGPPVGHPHRGYRGFESYHIFFGVAVPLLGTRVNGTHPNFPLDTFFLCTSLFVVDSVPTPYHRSSTLRGFHPLSKYPVRHPVLYRIRTRHRHAGVRPTCQNQHTPQFPCRPPFYPHVIVPRGLTTRPIPSQLNSTPDSTHSSNTLYVMLP